MKGLEEHTIVKPQRRAFFRRTLVWAVLLMVIAFKAEAQQDPMFTQYMNNVLSVNPAYAIVGTSMEVVAISRNQWVGIEGAPVTQALSVQMPMKKTDTGFGMTILSDEIGPVTQTSLYGDYAFRFRTAYRTYLSLGLMAGVNYYNTDYSILEYNDAGDPVFSGDALRKFLPNFGVGAFFWNDKLFASVSVPKCVSNRINNLSYSNQFSSREQIHVFAMAGYVFDINRDVKFKPYASLKFVANTPMSLDLSAHFLFYDRLWVGANWRVGDAVGAIAQIYVTKQFKFGYAYDVTATDLNSFNRGTHEVLISYALNLGRRKFLSPRYF